MSTYNSTVIEIFNTLKTTTDPVKREALMLQLAEQVWSEHDTTDQEMGDDYHSYFEEFETARLKYRQEAFKLSRLVCDIIPHSRHQGPEVAHPSKKSYPGDSDLN